MVEKTTGRAISVADAPDIPDLAFRGFRGEQDRAAMLAVRRGYTETICVRRPWRRRGLARALIARSFQVLKDQGMTEAALGVDAEGTTGALRLYEDLGFHPVKRMSLYRKLMEE